MALLHLSLLSGKDSAVFFSLSCDSIENFGRSSSMTIFRELLVVTLANDLSASLLYKITHSCNPVGLFMPGSQQSLCCSAELFTHQTSSATG